MIKRIKLLLLLSLVIFLPVNYIAAENKENNGATIAMGAAAGAVAGFGLYQLFSAFSSSSDKLVEDACKELMIAKQFTKHLEALEAEFEGLTNIEKRELILSIDEDLADQLASASNNRMINAAFYNDLKQNIKNLKYYQSKFPKRIRKLQRQRDQAKYKTVIDDMSELVVRIDKLLPKLDYLNQYLYNHKSYFDLDEVIETILKNYNSEIKAVSSKKIFVENLKNASRAKYRSFSYPLIEYVNGVDNDIYKIDKYIGYTYCKYPSLVKDAQDSKNKLRKIKDIITTDREYFSEKRSLEDEKARQSMINGGMFLLGAATGAVAASLSNEPKKEVIIKEEVIYTPAEEVVTYTPDEEVVIIE